jgi:hypothetical protein
MIILGNFDTVTFWLEDLYTEEPIQVETYSNYGHLSKGDGVFLSSLNKTCLVVRVNHYPDLAIMSVTVKRT